MCLEPFSQCDWTLTKAHCSEVLASPPTIWINLQWGNAADNVVVSANSLTIADVPNNGTVLGLLVRIISRQIGTHYFKSPLVTT